MKKLAITMIVLSFLFVFVSCGEDPVPNEGDTAVDADNGDTGDTGDTGNTGNTGDTAVDTDIGNTGNTGDTGDTGDTDCDSKNLGTPCSTDDECGRCMICINNGGGKCAKGCTSDADCTMSTGLKCNKKLARCTNIFASLSACNETKCPKGCCHADKGLGGVKCSLDANASVCGLCAQGEIFISEDSKCVPAVCSTSTDNCPSLNTGSTTPPASCFKCKSGEFICEPDTKTSGCSAGVIVNVTQCIPAGQQCVAGVSECCSGMPCVQGYCY